MSQPFYTTIFLAETDPVYYLFIQWPLLAHSAANEEPRI